MKIALRKALLLLALGPLLSACSGGVGDGETIERIDIISEDGVVTAFQCFYSGLRAIATFEEGGQEDVTLRGTWSSSNPANVAVSNGDLRTPAGFTVTRGTIAPMAAPQANAATISFNFVGLSASTSITIDEAQLELTPSVFDLAEGTGVNLVAIGLLGDPDEEDFAQLFSNNIANWAVSNDTAAEVTNPSRTQSGGSVSTMDVAGNQLVTVTADTDMENCNGVNDPGFASASLNIIDERFDRLDFRTLSLMAPRANSTNLLSTVAHGTDQIYRVLGVATNDDTPGGTTVFTQDLTSRILSNQGTDPDTDQGVFSEDSDVVLISGSTLRALASDTTRNADVFARVEQLDSMPLTNRATPENITVTNHNLVSIQLTSPNDPDPADPTTNTTESGAPGTVVPFYAIGTFDNGTPGNTSDDTTQDITPSAVFTTDDLVNTAAAPGGQISIDAEAEATMTPVSVDASRADNPFLDPTAQTSIEAAPSAELNIVPVDDSAAPGTVAGNTLDIAVFPAAQQPQATTCPDPTNIEPRDRCYLQATIQSTNQDVTGFVFWASSNTTIGQVGNAAPLVGEFAARVAGTTTVTARLYDDEGELIATGTANITVN